LASRSSTIFVAALSTSASNCLIILGVKARETMRRSRACRGSSMLIMEPKYSANSAGMSGMFVAPPWPELKTSGVRLASRMSPCLTRA
jgi:hypothetical protein